MTNLSSAEGHRSDEWILTILIILIIVINHESKIPSYHNKQGTWTQSDKHISKYSGGLRAVLIACSNWQKWAMLSKAFSGKWLMTLYLCKEESCKWNQLPLTQVFYRNHSIRTMLQNRILETSKRKKNKTKERTKTTTKLHICAQIINIEYRSLICNPH